MKSLNIWPQSETFLRHQASITLTVLLTIAAAAPQPAHAIWPFKSAPQKPSLVIKESGKTVTYKIVDGKTPMLEIVQSLNGGNVKIKGGNNNYRPDIDTQMKTIKRVGVSTKLTFVPGKTDFVLAPNATVERQGVPHIPTYYVTGDAISKMIVLDMEEGRVCVLRVTVNNGDATYVYDHVLVLDHARLGENVQIQTEQVTVADLDSKEKDPQSTRKKISVKLGLSNNSVMTLNYTSDMKKTLELIDLSQNNKELQQTAQEKLDELKKVRKETLTLKEQMKNVIFGQDLALDRLIQHILETKTNGMSKPKVLLAQGPSGVGKSLMAQTLVDLAYGDKKHFMEISGSEYNAGTHALDYMKLFGKAKGVSGGDEDGALIKWLKENNGKGVLVINEADKMHADIWKRMMEFLEKGRITDNSGQEVLAKNVVVFMTSNRGATRMFPSSVANWTQAQIDQRMAAMAQSELRGYYLQKEGQDDKTLPREILNRIDEIIPFGPLSQEAAVKIAHAAAAKIADHYQMEYGLNFEADPELVKYIALTGFTAADDARQIANQMKNAFSAVIRDGLESLNLKAGDHIHLTLAENTQHEKVIQASANNEVMTMPAPQEAKPNVLADAKKVAQLKSLNADLKKEIIGQDLAMDEISAAVKSFDLKPVKDRPFSAFLIGPSGNGKTETARALAKAEGIPLSVLSMGQIATMSDFDNIFGVGAQFQSGDTERPFERILRENPNGAVIVMDEISNMGGKDPGAKSALFKKLYEIFEEGKYTSPRDGRVFDLKKFKFILTGNDGEEMFAGVTADDVLLTTWQENRSPDKVRDLLRRSGVPNAFVNRMWKVILMKPLLSSEVDAVTQKLWDRDVNDFEKAYAGIKIFAADGFKQKLAKAFFTGDQGGRALRKALDNSSSALIGGALLASGIDTQQMQNVKVLVDIQDNLINKPYLSAGAPKRQVLFVAHVYQGDQFIHTENIDVTEDAVAQVLMNSRTARAVAYHEAGHAIANNPDVTQEKTVYVTIRGGRTQELEYYGYARTEPVGRGATGNYDHDKAVASIARLWAGRKAQEMAGFPADAGWSNDLEKIRKIGTLYLTKWGLDPELAALPVDKDGNVQASGPAKQLLDQRLKELMAEGEQMSAQLLQTRWRAVRAMTAELLLNGEIKEERINQIRAALMDGKAQGIKKLDWNFFDYKARTNKCSGVFSH